jgi:SAM-dependent methyltransferase
VSAFPKPIDDSCDELPEAPQLVLGPTMEPVPVKLLRLDLACGENCAEGFDGVEIEQLEGVKYVHDLTTFPWPFETDSVDEVRCSHYLEHLDGDEQMAFMVELHRILKPGSGALITTPFGGHARAYQDPTHKREVWFESYFIYGREYRVVNKLQHWKYAQLRDVDFEIRCANNQVEPFWAMRTQETQAMAARYFFNVIPDLTVLCIKRRRDGA